MIAPVVDALGPWTWIVLGLALAGLEMLVPGVFLIWLGLAAVLTGIADAVFGLSWQASSILFARLAVACVALGRALTRRREEEAPDQPFLNRRGEALVGRVFRLEGPLHAGEGRVRIGDSVWRVTGSDATAGAPVKVVRVDGATLVVHPVPIEG